MSSQSSGDPSGDPGHSDAHPDHHLQRATPQDHERMGLDRNTVEGAMVNFASTLDGKRRKHRIVAWAILFFMFGLPLLLVAVQSILER